MEVRQYSKRREMIEWSQLTPLLGQSAMVCIPLAVVPIVRKFLRTRAKWRTTYVKSVLSTQTYEIPSEAEFDPLEEEIDEFLEATNDMASCLDISDELANIVTAITALTTAVNDQDTLLQAIADATEGQDLFFNDLEEVGNEIINVLGGTPVVID